MYYTTDKLIKQQKKRSKSLVLGGKMYEKTFAHTGIQFNLFSWTT